MTSSDRQSAFALCAQRHMHSACTRGQFTRSRKARNGERNERNQSKTEMLFCSAHHRYIIMTFILLYNLISQTASYIWHICKNCSIDIFGASGEDPLCSLFLPPVSCKADYSYELCPRTFELDKERERERERERKW